MILCGCEGADQPTEEEKKFMHWWTTESLDNSSFLGSWIKFDHSSVHSPVVYECNNNPLNWKISGKKLILTSKDKECEFEFYYSFIDKYNLNLTKVNSDLSIIYTR